MNRIELTDHITQLVKENFIKFDDQQKVLQVVREALLQHEKGLVEKIKDDYSTMKRENQGSYGRAILDTVDSIIETIDGRA